MTRKNENTESVTLFLKAFFYLDAKGECTADGVKH